MTVIDISVGFFFKFHSHAIMSNFRELLEIYYEYPVERISNFFSFYLCFFLLLYAYNAFLFFFFQYIIVDNQKVVRLQLLNEVGVLIIPLVSSV